MKRTLLTLTVLLTFVGGAFSANSHSEEFLATLKALDAALAESKQYVAIREDRIASLKDMLSATDEPSQVYALCHKLFEEYYPYNFDLALSYGNKMLGVADDVNDRALESKAHLNIARLYTVAGMYTEALGAFQKIDTLSLPREERSSYYMAHIHFARDFKEYSKDEELRERCDASLNYYRKALYAMPRKEVACNPSYTLDSLNTRVLDLYDHENYESAMECAERLVEKTSGNEHPFAIAAYYMSLVLGQQGDVEGQMIWLGRSAVADTHLAVKDNASLCVLASLLAGEGDVERAFNYIRISIDDARFYNAKLRQWQVASRMNAIEQVYHDMVSRQQSNSLRTTLLVSLLACVLLAVCVYVVLLLRKTRKTQTALKAKNEEVEAMNETLSQTNRQLQSLNLTIAEANMVKEEYIGLFLSMCSDYIDKIASMQRRVRKGIKSGSLATLDREFPSNDIIEAEKEHFYEVFDSAFLNLYPNFVEEFNSLLEEDGQVELKKGERLNTELRIFALIRLGITDSSKIALLLHYSVNTIYNYRAKVKNRAKCDREHFEQTIKTIGAFKP